MDYAELIEILKEHGVHFAPGLTEMELSDAEECYGIVFPKALREFYSVGMPVSSDPPVPAPTLRWDWFPRWNDFSEESTAIIRRQMDWPLTGILHDVENGCWMKAWGERPEKMEERLEVCRAVFAERSPKLIPVYVRSYVPQMDGEDDPPVISVYGLDTLYYGENLADYLHRRFVEHSHEVSKPDVTIPFWHNIITGGSDNFKIS